MKRLIVPLIVLTCLVGACSSPTKTAQKPSGPPVSTGTRNTAWGELPTYDQQGHAFDVKPEKLRVPVVDHTQWVTFDVMVNADGSVKDATINQTSGNPAVDQAVLAAYIGTHYSLKLGPTDPAPYVVQQAIVFSKPGEGPSDIPTVLDNPYGLGGRQGSKPPPGSPYSRGPGGGWGP